MQAGELLNDSPLASLMELLMAPGSNVYSNVNVLFCFVANIRCQQGEGEGGNWSVGEIEFSPKSKFIRASLLVN